MPSDPRIPTAAPIPADVAARLDAKQRMVITTAKLLQRQGYHATGLKQVVHDAAAPRGSIYHHFPGGKEELAVQAIQVAAAELTRAIEAAVARTRTPGELVCSIGRALTRWLAGSAYLEGCPVSTVTLEVAPTSTALTEACQQAYDGWVELIADRLRDHGVDDDEARALGTTAVSALEGALLLCRAARDTAALTSTADHVAELLDGRLGGA